MVTLKKNMQIDQLRKSPKAPPIPFTESSKSKASSVQSLSVKYSMEYRVVHSDLDATLERLIEYIKSNTLICWFLEVMLQPFKTS